MWFIDAIEAVPGELDFSSSGQGPRAVTAVVADGVRLINALELLVEPDPASTQVEICESCGVYHCAPGGWVAFRRVGDKVIWTPVWEEMLLGAREVDEYAPPLFLRTKGAPCFGPQGWERLRALHRGFPPVSSIPALAAREAALLCQASAPGGALGGFPEMPRLRRDLPVAVSDGDLRGEAELIDRCLERHFRAGFLQRVDVVPENVPLAPIELWLDLPGTPGWTSFARVQDRVCLLLGGRVAVVEAGAT